MKVYRKYKIAHIDYPASCLFPSEMAYEVVNVLLSNGDRRKSIMIEKDVSLTDFVKIVNKQLLEEDKQRSLRSINNEKGE